MIDKVEAAFLLMGFCCVLGLLFYAFKSLGKNWSIHLLFQDFRRKMWMTFLLGICFFGLYIGLVTVTAYLFKGDGTTLFLSLYQRPVEYIYKGLWVFSCLSLSIYFVRMVIKYFYLTHGKDS